MNSSAEGNGRRVLATCQPVGRSSYSRSLRFEVLEDRRLLAAADLDTIFHFDGIATTPIGASDETGRTVLVQTDGKIVVVGDSMVGTNRDFAVVRYNSDGTLDTTFSDDGIVTTDLGGSTDYAYSAALQSDGKIVAVGARTNGSVVDFAVVRYNTDGSLDTTFDGEFDGNGIVTTDVSITQPDEAHGVAIQSDGKIVVAGWSSNGSNNDFAVARYNTDGSPDATFSGDGKLTRDMRGGNDDALAVSIQSDGRIVVVGNAYSDSSDYDFALARFNTNGTPDNTFSGDGKLTEEIGSSADFATAVAIQSDGKLVVGGYSYNGADYDFAVTRHNTNGSLDTSFGDDGRVTTAIGAANDIIHGVAIQANGRIVAVGETNNGGNDDIAIVRYNTTNGSLDTSFDGDGMLITVLGSAHDSAEAVAIQPDGKIVVAGQYGNGANSDFAALRYGRPETFVVDTLTDESDGDYSAGDLSLREAILLANNSLGAADIIEFAPSLTSGAPATINLTALGELIVTDSVTINGPDASLLTIKAFDPTPATQFGDGSRVFTINDGSDSTTQSVTIRELTIAGGDVLVNGGGIYTHENLDVVDSIVVGNSAYDGGGGIFVDGDVIINIVDSTILLNRAFGTDAYFGVGGGIFVGLFVSANIVNTTIRENTARQEDGGGIFNDGELFIAASAIIDNFAWLSGGGIFNRGDLTIVSSTISGNGAFTSTGGAIYNQDGNDAVIAFTTITNSSGAFTALAGPFVLSHSIVSNNYGGDLSGNATASFSLIGDGSGAAITGTGNLIGSHASPIDALLGPLADNGGPTMTHALLPGSPAIDAGDLAALPGINGIPENDQRGAPFTRVVGSRIDIGAVEREPILVVDTLSDESDGDYSAGNFSLREAILIANATSGDADVINFAPSLTSGGPATINLTAIGELLISGGVTINGPGASLLTIKAFDPDVDGTNDGDGHRVFFISNGNDSTFLDVAITGLTLTGGDSHGAGGAIYSRENLMLTQSVVTGNSSSPDSIAGDGTSNPADRGAGGGIFSFGGVLTLGDVRVTNNDGEFGAGIFNSGELHITDSVIAGNDAQFGSSIPGNASLGFSGGIHHRCGNALIVGSTITDNHSTWGGGGISLITVTGNFITIRESSISENMSAFGGGIYHSAPWWTGESSGEVLVQECVIRDNEVSNYGGEFDGDLGVGGGILNQSATLTLIDTSVVSNYSAGYGAGIGNINAAMITIEGSLIQGNHADRNGGGIQNDSVLGIQNSTISGNTASGSGGGILNSDVLNVSHSTITENLASDGGGIFSYGFADLALDHSIVSGNSRIDTSRSDITGPVTAAYSLVGDNAGTSLVESPVGSTDANGNLIGGPTNGPVNALFAPLADNGGPTMTHALLPVSPAIDAGDPLVVPLPGVNDMPEFDQRGTPFDRIRDGDGLGGAQIDIGAFEVQQPPAPELSGDYNRNAAVDAADYVLWRKTLATTGVTAYSGADGDGDTTIDQDDYQIWRSHFGNSMSGSAIGHKPSPNVAMETSYNDQSMIESPASTTEAAAVSPFISATNVQDPQLPTEPRERVFGQFASTYGIQPKATVKIPARSITLAEPGAADRVMDHALVAWAASLRSVKRQFDESNETIQSDTLEEARDDIGTDALDGLFATLRPNETLFRYPR